MAYRLEIKRKVYRRIRQLPLHVQKRMLAVLKALEQDPRPQGCKRLQGGEFYAVRVGDYRIVYSVDDAGQTVTVLRARHRRDVYRGL
ncbi:MAG: type II toxin-antitoxin system RelE/ParE family toxin [Caldilineae bacterium]|nr:MAG: type II toxin-antitoxin system RelE/ParE family toxin [Caldilineae bacterium]